MTYQEFNRKVLEFYLERSSSEFFTLSIDRQEIQQIIMIEKLSLFHNLRSPWHLLLKPFDNIPQYFGLIAIQCFAASEMQSDKEKTASAYKIRLCRILLLEENQLQTLFKGDDIDYPIQEEIWYSAKQYFEDNYDLKIKIPECTRYAGRFVQFPKSQALFNTEDLKYFSIFFSEEFQINENIPFNYFKKKLNTWLSNTYKEKISKRAKELLEDEEKKEGCTEQVYNYFNRWDGILYNIKTNKNRVPESPAKQEMKPEQQKIILIFDRTTPTFYLKGKIIDNNSVLNQLNYKYIHRNIVIFNECDYYPNEYDDSRFLYKGTVSYILINPQSCPSENRYLLQNNLGIIKMANGCILYKFTIQEDNIHPVLNKYFQGTTPIKLRGGIKISRANLYLKGYGPSIVGTIDCIIHNNRKCIYNSENAETGLYKVRVDNYKDLEFTVVDQGEKTAFIHSKEKGWNLTKLSTESVFDIEGTLLNIEYDRNETPIIRSWINANLKKKKEKNLWNNILIRAIENSKA